MPIDETLGVLAHRGGLVVRRPELSVGIVGAVSRPTGLEVELLARRPLDRRGATERQAGIRAGRAGVVPAPRRLLPAYDEGLDLRVGRLDPDGRAHWVFGSRTSSSSGDHSGGTHGPSLRTTLRFPPLYDHASLVLAWPEIGFPESIVDLPLPPREAVERGTVSVWDAPVDAGPAPESLRRRTHDGPHTEPAVEAGRIVAGPRVLSRGADAVVGLTRLTAVDGLLSVELLSMARGPRAGAMSVVPGPGRPPDLPGATVAVVHDGEAVWAPHGSGGSSGGPDVFRSRIEFVLPDPGGAELGLVVAWPAAGLPDVLAPLPLDAR
ncbi:hypothetical protein AB0J72_53115 [Dactylosporangium sp. NPDC049742]|uniref:hypothetical protein n=1 Tax=Dactylosporangium sp. NPDC049742 TaxID=3154737 RepID=UPI0034256715